MTTIITVPGSANGLAVASFTFQDTNTTGISVAKSIQDALGDKVTEQTLNVTSVSGSNMFRGEPTIAGFTQEVYVAPGKTNLIRTTAGYKYVVNESDFQATIAAAPNTLLLTGAFGGVFGATGAATIVAANGNNVITQTGAGSVFLMGGDANDTISADGSGTLGGASGLNRVTLNGTGQLYLAGQGGSDSIFFGTRASDTSDTISAGNGANFTVFGASGRIRFTNGGKAADWQGGYDENTTDTITGQEGNVSVIADPYNGIIFRTGKATVSAVNGGTSGATVYGANNAIVNLSGSAGTANRPMFVVAADGNETLNASASTGTVWLSINTSVAGANAGAVQMIGGSAADFLVVGGAPGSGVMTGNGGDDSFVFFRQTAASANTITDFSRGTGNNDAIFIEGYGYGANNVGAPGVIGTAASVGGGVQLTLNGGTTILFTNFGTNVGALQSALQGRVHTS